MTEVPHVVSSVEELLGLVEIKNVTPYELSVKKHEQPIEAAKQLELCSQFQNQSTENGSILLRCRGEAVGEGASYVVDIVALFAAARPVQVPDEVAHEFAQTVGVPVVYPYLRSELQSMARKVGARTPVLAFFRLDGKVAETRVRFDAAPAEIPTQT